jgi:hypothetical protein
VLLISLIICFLQYYSVIDSHMVNGALRELIGFYIIIDSHVVNGAL